MRSTRILGLRLLTFFHTEYGTPSGPGVDDGEDGDSVGDISSLVRGSAEEWYER